MDTLSFKTISAKPDTIKRDWYIVDASNLVLGRMSSKIASVLKGKNKPYYTPNLDCGDNVIVINAEKVHLTGEKWNQKEYISYSGYAGGQKRILAKDLMIKNPIQIIEKAIKGMLPKNILGRHQGKKLFVYQGEEHPHSAQKPKNLKI